MAFVEGGSEGSLNGTTPVTVVPSPGSGVRRLMRTLTICNVDTAAVTVNIGKKKASTTYRIATKSLDPGDTAEVESVQVLDATDESIVVEMNGAAATTNPTYTASYGDAS